MNKLILTVLTAAALCGCVSVYETPGTVYVDEFDLSASSCGYGKKVTKLESARGFYSHPESGVVFHSNGKVVAFDAKVGIVPGSKSEYRSYGKPAAEFRVWADGKVVYASGVLTEGMKPAEVHVDLAGAREIILETRSGGMWKDFVAADCNWLDARFSYDAGASLEVERDASLFAQLGILTPPEAKEPKFNGADIWGVRPGHPVIYRVPVSGVKPMKFTASNLPAGVTLDAKGVLRGTAPSKAGDYDILVTAENAAGRAERVIRLAVGDVISLTPPMGWNSWNVWGFGLTAERAMASARVMEESGLGDYGWAYVNLDDWWQMNNSGVDRVQTRMKDLGLAESDVTGPARNADGTIVPNRSFPDMKGLADYIHSFGFKAGLYSSPGPLTCGKCEGSYGHELADAKSWADWGFDYVKYDWCSYDQIVEKETGRKHWYSGDRASVTQPAEWKMRPYTLLRDCLKAQNRDIVYSFCQYGMGGVEKWGREAGAQCWRSFDDLKDGWAWMEQAIESRIGGEFWKYCGRGFWPDPDMMIIGMQRSFGHDHPTMLTPNEQYTHLSVWAMLSAPLLTGCDLTRLDEFTRSLLVNGEVIAISQDRLGEVARRIRHVDSEDVWFKRLADGSIAVALVNRAPIARNIRVPFAELAISGTWKARDCWTHECQGRVEGELAFKVLPHATTLLRLRPADCPKCD